MKRPNNRYFSGYTTSTHNISITTPDIVQQHSFYQTDTWLITIFWYHSTKQWRQEESWPPRRHISIKTTRSRAHLTHHQQCQGDHYETSLYPFANGTWQFIALSYHAYMVTDKGRTCFHFFPAQRQAVTTMQLGREWDILNVDPVTFPHLKTIIIKPSVADGPTYRFNAKELRAKYEKLHAEGKPFLQQSVIRRYSFD